MSDIPVTITGENGTPAPVVETPASIDFGALKAQAAKYLEQNFSEEPKEPAPVESKPAPSSEQDPSKVRVKGASETKPEEKEEPPVEEAPEEQVDAPKATASLKDDDLVEITVNGKAEVLPWKEAKGYISGGRHFTKNMQDVARQRQEVDAAKADIDQLRAREDSFRTFLKDPGAILKFVEMQYPDLLQRPTAAEAAHAVATDPTVDPNEIATLGQVEAVVQANLRKVEALVEKTKASIQEQTDKAAADRVFAEQQAKHAIVIDGTLKEIFTANPILTAIPNSEDLIRYQVAQMMTPQTTEAEALDMFRSVANEVVSNLQKHTVAQKKLAVAKDAKAKLETKGIEPKGGAAPQLKPTNYRDADGRVDLNKVRNMAKAYLDQM